MEIQHAGYGAYLAGQFPKESPSSASSENIERQSAWFRGYAASKTDRARANHAAANGSRSVEGSSEDAG